MSLIHWWPLNGNLNDYGINPVSLVVTNAPATQYINGKIGQCYNFNGSAWMQASGISVGTDCSICCWAKTSYSGTMMWGIQCAASNWMNFFYQYYLCLNIGDSEDNPFKDDSGNPLTPLLDGAWHHYVIVFKGIKRAKLYIDGVYRGQATSYRDPTMNNQNFTVGTWNYSSHGYYWTGGINDVRIYDHALSVKEIKEISKGLVLHYDFNDPYIEGTTNLFAGKTDFSNTSYWSRSQQNSITPTADSEGNITLYGYNVSGNTQSYIHNSAANVSVNPSTRYTLSVKVKFSSTNAYLNLYFYDLNSSSSIINTNVWRIGCEANQVGQWIEISRTFDTQSGTSKAYVELNCYQCPSSDFVILKNNSIQLEQKNHATPYTPNTRAPGLVYDCSGYGYNGTQNGNIQILNDSACGQYSAKFYDSSLSYIQSESPTSEVKTISAWVKKDVSDGYNGVIVSDYKSNLGIGFWYSSGQKLLIGTKTYRQVFPLENYNNSGWNHIVVVADSELGSCYINGQKITGNDTNYYTSVLDKLVIGCRNNGSYSEFFNGQLSDVKLFATALSASDVLAEYNRKAAIDRNGKVFTGEFVETNNNLLSVAEYNIETQAPFDGWLGPITNTTYNANYPNPNLPGMYGYQQGNMVVSITSNGIRLYSSANDSYTNYDQWGGLFVSPMKTANCLFKGHRYVLSWHVKGKSTRSMEIHWTSQPGWGTSTTNPGPTFNKIVSHPRNFQGEMECFCDFTITDDIWKVCTNNDGNSGFEVGSTYLSYAAFKIGYTYEDTGELGTDIYISNLQLYDITEGKSYKIDKANIIKATAINAGVVDKAKIYSDGVLSSTDVEEL